MPPPPAKRPRPPLARPPVARPPTARPPVASPKPRSQADVDKAVLQALTRAARRHAGFTYFIIAAVTVPTLMQIVVGDRAIALASVDPIAIRNGDWIRLLTGTYLHGSLYHYLGNMMALLSFGSIMESRASRAQLPLVYLLSGLGGSLASTIAPPDVPSIGASGAIVGVLGYLFIYSRRQRYLFPAAFRQATASAFTSLAVFGALGFWFIDNAGHVGGALTGIVLAGLIVDHAEMREPEIHRPLLDLLGWVAAAAIAVGAVLTVAKMLK